MQYNLERKFSAGGRQAFFTTTAQCPAVTWACDSWQSLGTKVEEFRAGASTSCPSSQDVSLMHISGGVSSGSIRLMKRGREHSVWGMTLSLGKAPSS